MLSSLSTPPGFVSHISDKHYEYIKLNCFAYSTATIMLCLRLKTLQLLLIPSLITFLPFSTSNCMHHLSTPKHFPTESKAVSQYSLSSVLAITILSLGNWNNFKSCIITVNLTSRSGSQGLLCLSILPVKIIFLQNSS